MTTINGTKNLGDFEYQKFRQDSTGKPSVSVVNPDGGTQASSSNQTNGTQKTQIVDAAGDAMTVNAEGRGDVVQHAHPDSSTIFFSTGSVAGSTDFIIVDISNTTDYHHILTNYVHLEHLIFQTDADGSAAYTIQLGFLENVDATNGDFYTIGGVSGNKSVGQSRFETLAIYPNGAQCTSQHVTTSSKSLNDTAFQTDVNLRSTLDPTTANVPSGNGDLVLRVIIAAGSVIVSGSIAYHTH